MLQSLVTRTQRISTTSRSMLLLSALALVLAPAAVVRPLAQAAPQATPQTATLPARLSDAAFWKLATDTSEPGGYFRITDNYTSNEGEVAQVWTRLRDRGINGGVYLGVGPEQNFSYIAAVRPAMAFILDIRRQAAMQHLLFKAVFELATDRADFIAILFSKPRPSALAPASPIQDTWNTFATIATDPAVAEKNLARILDLLTKKHEFALGAEDAALLQAVYRDFTSFGPVISTRGTGAGNALTFADLTGWMQDEAGVVRSFLATEDDFQFVKGLHERNLIVPVTGDFGGPKALRGLATYIKGAGATVSAFYVSNVEQYLFMDGKDRAFYDSVAMLPLTETSVFIRPYSLRRGGRGFGRGGFSPAQPSAAAEPLCPVQGFLKAVAGGRILSNNDAMTCGR